MQHNQGETPQIEQSEVILANLLSDYKERKEENKEDLDSDISLESS